MSAEMLTRVLNAWVCVTGAGGDQGLLNMYFSDWATKDLSRRLPFLYNVVGHAFYTYTPAFAK